MILDLDLYGIRYDGTLTDKFAAMPLPPGGVQWDPAGRCYGEIPVYLQQDFLLGSDGVPVSVPGPGRDFSSLTTAIDGLAATSHDHSIHSRLATNAAQG